MCSQLRKPRTQTALQYCWSQFFACLDEASAFRSAVLLARSEAVISVAASISDASVGLSLPTRMENADPYYAKAKGQHTKSGHTAKRIRTNQARAHQPRGPPPTGRHHTTQIGTGVREGQTNQTQTEESQSTKGHRWPHHTHTSQAKRREGISLYDMPPLKCELRRDR